jgi:hypothetical protein
MIAPALTIYGRYRSIDSALERLNRTLRRGACRRATMLKYMYVHVENFAV